jgi:hypothetical protein
MKSVARPRILFWSLHLNGPMKRSDRVASLEEAKDQFKTRWEAWKAWANLKERDQAEL